MARERCSCNAEIDGVSDEERKEWRRDHRHEFASRPEGGGGMAVTQTQPDRTIGFVPGDFHA